MAGMLTPHKTQMGWIVEVPPEMAAALQIDPGSIVLLYSKEGVLETEILPPPSDELQSDFERLFDKYQKTFEDLKRIGD